MLFSIIWQVLLFSAITRKNYVERGKSKKLAITLRS